MTRKSKQQWQDLVNEFEQSKLTQTQFCEQKGLNLKYFSLKRSRLLVRDSDNSPFIKASVKKTDVEAITLQFRSVTIQFSATTPPATIITIAQALA